MEALVDCINLLDFGALAAGNLRTQCHKFRIGDLRISAHENGSGMTGDHLSNELSVADQDLVARTGESRHEEEGENDTEKRFSRLFGYIPPMVASMRMPIGATMA
ncbi:hypothetical protein [Agrobacterium salinitolerans]|uniref:hypothetical protein n=1 Tax=Agrobacterium salinitolerans TaxID=1183413 RepID=UPI00403FDB0A